jgi:hypothetical protein
MAWLEKLDSDNNPVKQWLKPSYIEGLPGLIFLGFIFPQELFVY